MAEKNAPSVVCLGFFDGVHKGHLALLNAARKAADEKRLLVCVHTFDHAPGKKSFELTSLEEREDLLRRFGADEIAVSTFDDSLRHMSGEEFFKSIVLEKLNARHVVCGDDHRFGYKGSCGTEELKRFCEEAGLGLTVVPQVALKNGQRISSSAIRQALLSGDEELASEMLGRPVSREMLARVQQV